jgi:hypothetical protein
MFLSARVGIKQCAAASNSLFAVYKRQALSPYDFITNRMSEEQGRTNPPGNDPYSDSENEDGQKVEVPGE